MQKTDIMNRIREIVVEHLGVDADQVKPDAHFINDLGADSLGTVELIMSLEEAFNLDIPDEQAEQIRTVGDALIYIEQHTP